MQLITLIQQIYKRYYVTILSFCVALLFIDVIVDPSNKILHLKYFLFGGIFVVGLPSLVSKQLSVPKSLVFLTVFVSLFMPLYAISVGLLNSFVQNTTLGEIVYLNSFLFFLLLPIIVINRIELTKVFYNASLLIVLITGAAYVIMLINPNTFGSIYSYLVVDKGAAAYALRKYGDYTLLMMYYRTSPLLVFPLSYYLYKIFIAKSGNSLLLDIFILITIIITLFLSGTRANILSLGLILLFYILFSTYKKSKPFALVLSSIYLLIFFYGASKIGSILLSRTEISNVVKLGHLLSYFEHFSNNIGIYLFGQGIGGTIYSTGVHRAVYVTELTYFEVIRIWGLPIMLFFGAILTLPIIKELRNKNISHLFIAYLAYLFIAGTNPLLLSSTGMLVLVYVFSKTFYSKQNQYQLNDR